MKSKWPIKRLSEVAEIEMGQSPKGSSYNTSGEGVPLINGPVEFGKTPFSRTKKTKFTTEPTKICKVGDLILCVRGSTTGRMNIAGYESCIGRGVASIRSEKYQDWINFFIHTNRETIYRLGSGATFPNVSGSMLAKLEIPIPPETEQKRLVAIVDEAFEGIDRAIANTKKNRTNARELFESYLNTILSGQGKQWKETTLGKEIDLLTGFAFKSSGYTDSDKSIRLLRGDNIIPGSLRWDGVKRWQESKVNEYLRYQLQEGDVVLAMDRPWIKTGLRRAQISKDDLPCLLVQRTACLRGGDNLENRFLLYLISGRAFTQHVLGSQTGLSVPHISGTQIQSFKFSKPSLREQYSIIDSLDELKSETKRLEAIYQRKLAALKELKQSILRKAFTGELIAKTTHQTIKAAKETIAA